MILSLYSEDAFLIEKEVKRLKKDNKVTPIIFDFSDAKTDFFDFIYETQSIDLFGEKKFIWIKNPIFLTSKGKLTSSQEESFKQMLTSNDDSIDLLFTLVGNKFDTKKKTVKWLKEYGGIKVFESLKAEDVKQLILKANKQYNWNLSKEILTLLIQFNPTIETATQAIEKINLYQEPLTLDIFEKLIIDNSSRQIFDLSNALIEKEFKKSWLIYQEIKDKNVEVSNLLYILASKVRQLYQVKVLKSQGYNQAQIAEKLGLKDSFVWVLMNKVGQRLSAKECLSILQDIFYYDQQMKTFSIDKQLDLEIWLLNFGRKYGKS